MTTQRRARGKRSHVGITDVAREAGVSVTTVSHVLSAHRPVAAATRRRVLDVIDRLGWQPNELARSMRRQRTHTIGLVVPDITNPFYPALARGMLDVLTPAGYVGILCDTDGDDTTERAIIAQMVTRRVDALAVAPGHPRETYLQSVVDAGIPVVHLGGDQPRPGIDVVVTDDRDGAHQVSAHLLDRGYTRIAFIGRQASKGPPQNRLAGYLAAHAERGIKPDKRLIAHASGDRAGGVAGMARLLDLPRPPDAVVCINDIVAIGALDEAHARGLRVPDDIAVTGFDDVDIATLVSPALTTVSHQIRQMGQQTAQLLLDRLAPGSNAGPTRITIPAHLVVRDSS